MNALCWKSSTFSLTQKQGGAENAGLENNGLEFADWTRRRRGLCCEFLEVLAACLPVVVEAGPVRSEQDPSRVSAVCRPPSNPS